LGPRSQGNRAEAAQRLGILRSDWALAIDAAADEPTHEIRKPKRLKVLSSAAAGAPPAACTVLNGWRGSDRLPAHRRVVDLRGRFAIPWGAQKKVAKEEA